MPLRHLLLVLALLAFAALPVRAGEPVVVRVYAGDFPPYVGADAEGPAGIMVDLLDLVGQRADIEFDLQVVPWARAQHLVSERKREAMIIPLTRTPAREDNYDWVVPLLEDPLAIIGIDPALARRDFSELHHVTIGVQTQTPNEALLREMGFERVVIFNSEAAAARMLWIGRIYAWFARPMVAREVFQRIGGNPDTLAIGPQRSTAPMYLAAAQDAFEEHTIAKIRRAFDEIIASGLYDEVLARY